jgi:hypothetical protein
MPSSIFRHVVKAALGRYGRHDAMTLVASPTCMG